MKYVTVRDYLVELIDTRLSVGDVVPSERELAERFGISRMTVRQAVDSLVSSGMLERRRGSGTYVRAPKVHVQSRISSFSEEMRQRGMIPDTRVLRDEEISAAPDVAVWLGIEPGEPVHYIYRVRLADGVPMAVERTWIAARVMPDLLTDGVPASIYGAMAAAGLVPTWGEDAIEAVSGDALVCEHLQIPRRVGCIGYQPSYLRRRYRDLLFPILVPRGSLQTMGSDLWSTQNPVSTSRRFTMKRVEHILAALGGVDNVVSIEPCVTRLRCQVRRCEQVDEQALRRAGAHGVTVQGHSVQVIVGPDADLLASDLEDLWEEDRES